MRPFGPTPCLQDDPARIEACRAYHQAVWPGVLARLRELRTLLRGRRLSMHPEAEDHGDPARDFPRIDEDPVARQRNALMATLQERAPEAGPDERWAPMEPVFDLDWPSTGPEAPSAAPLRRSRGRPRPGRGPSANERRPPKGARRVRAGSVARLPRVLVHRTIRRRRAQRRGAAGDRGRAPPLARGRCGSAGTARPCCGSRGGWQILQPVWPDGLEGGRPKP